MTLIPMPGQEPDNLPLQHDKVGMGLTHVLRLIRIWRDREVEVGIGLKVVLTKIRTCRDRDEVDVGMGPKVAPEH